jgi:hypothetical protein
VIYSKLWWESYPLSQDTPAFSKFSLLLVYIVFQLYYLFGAENLKFVYWQRAQAEIDQYIKMNIYAD